jgi:hypothetical protein
MREAPIPATVVLRDQISGAAGNAYSFRAYALGHWLNDKRWTTPITNLDAMLRLKKEFEKSVGQTMQLEEGDLKLLAEVIKAPTVDREPPLVYIQVRGYDDLLLGLAAATDNGPSRIAK